MAIYKSYVEAVIANGSVKGVLTDGNHFYLAADARAHMWDLKPCNPADYLETLADFHERGLRLVDGDYYIRLDSSIATIGDDITAYSANDPLSSNDRRFVIKAAADQVETPEEKEAFDAMTDTAPQQVESLSGSEKPSNSEWNGKGLPPVGAEFDFSRNGVSWDRRVMLFNDGITCLMAHSEYTANRWHYKSDDTRMMFRKPETPEQRAERESMERKAEIEKMLSISINFNNTDLPKTIARIIDDAGYRKECKK